MQYSIAQLQEMFSAELQKHIGHLPTQPEGLYEPIHYTLGNSGKRIRPVFVLAACNMFSSSVKPAIPAALAIEVFHNFTLLHDDIMDKAPLRRNKPTVHVKWSENTAILSGDVMSIFAYQYLTEIADPLLGKILRIFNKMAVEVCEGQQLDMNFEKMPDVSADEYLNMIRLKTSVLIAASMEIGALLGNASPDQAQRLYHFGLNLGLAFQLEDDLLDVYGNPETFGKTIGGDILANKKTYLLIKALELASSEQRKELNYWLEATDFDAKTKIKAVTELYNLIGVKEIAQEKILWFHKESMHQLELISVPDSHKSVLKTIANKLIAREK